MMRRVVILLVLALGAMAAWACEKNDSTRLTFGKTVHDFGEISMHAGKIMCQFECVNNSDSSVVILGVLANCGCTTPVYPKDPIQPGATAVVQVTYDTTGRPDGEFEKEVVLHTTAPKPRIALTVRGHAVK